ncbi:MAG: LPXTG cell wall anchor domain-containing protein [Ruminococcaceae bacterium]|nr:LPXTG cell wall anchor domain-containing protein [Oscillospiraceae bacterium]
MLEEGSCYAITEIVPATFAASYGGETLSLTIDGKVTTLCVVDGQNPIITPTVQITNSPAYKLPQTGGTGTQSYYASGLLLILSAALIAVYKKFHQEKGGPYID